VEVVRRRSQHGPNLEDVAEAGSHEQRGARQALLNQRVRRDRGPVHDHLDRGDVDPVPLGEHVEAPSSALLQPVRRARNFLNGELAALEVDVHDVGERPADVDPDDSAHRCSPASQPMAWAQKRE
jgi:hypothetical protein